MVVTDDQRLGFSHALVRDALEAGLPDSDATYSSISTSPVPSSRAVDRFPRGSRPPLQRRGTPRSAGSGRAPLVDRRRGRCPDPGVRGRRRRLRAGAGRYAGGRRERPAALLRRRGDCLLLSGDLAAARVAFAEACDLARATGRPEDFASAALGFAAGLSGFEVRLFDHAQIDLLEEALGAPARGTTANSAHTCWPGSPSRCRSSAPTSVGSALAAESVAMARRLGSPAGSSPTASRRTATPSPARRTRSGATSESGEIVEIAAALGDPALELLGLRFRIVALAEQGRLERGRRRRPGVRRLWPSGCVSRSTGGTSRCGEGSPHTSSATSRSCAGGPRRSSRWPVQRTARTRRSSVRSCASGTTWSRAAAPTRWARCSTSSPRSRSCTRPATACSRSSRDSPTTCDGGRPRRSGGWSGTSSSTPSGCRTCASRPGRSSSCAQPGEPSRVVYDLLRPHAHRFAVDGIAAGFHGSVERYLGSLAWLAGGSRAESADAHFERALAANERAGALLAAAHTRRAHAAVLLDRAGPGDVARAPAPARRGRYRLRADAACRTGSRRSDRLVEWPPASALGAAPDRPTSRPRRRRCSGGPARSGRSRSAAVASTVRDSKGMRDLAVLLARPGTEVHALDLVSDAGSVRHEGDLGDALDETARAAYRRRIGAARPGDRRRRGPRPRRRRGPGADRTRGDRRGADPRVRARRPAAARRRPGRTGPHQRDVADPRRDRPRRAGRIPSWAPTCATRFARGPTAATTRRSPPGWVM